MTAALSFVMLRGALASGVSVQPLPCTDAERAALAEAAERMQTLDDRAAAERLQSNVPSPCRDLMLARLATAGWVEARALAAVGGDPAELTEVNEILRALDRLGTDPSARLDERLQTAYATAAIRAAVAAAQDERPEMEVLLAHARDVAASLAGARHAALWPLGIDDLEGELWLEVDWFDRAQATFERASPANRSARSRVGLARTLRRLADPGACQAFTDAAAMNLGAAARREVDEYLDRCRP